ncbi:hypothetical protein P154DRAFT_538535 [Amniculicola lignicola CBS 123094]|uniref:Mitochondrial outer membrane transport complex Sam37/metaxin N-terminal domain-containing protein n=1 Tax=Amniculicola lignicola CBS 123094 TaxID=1392246 RepID=A0A6A5W3Q0_9PLEO|nr:hypothetical protein P154DRAFT_538535 [Amniculicola lignicola CBS 123094]
MALELHVWGPAFGLPSIDAECIATICYLQRICPSTGWRLVVDAPSSSQGDLPLLVDGAVRARGFASVVSYLRTHRAGACDLDHALTHQQQTDSTAFAAFIQFTGGPLIDLSLYVSAENFRNTTSSAYTAILPWHRNYTIPPARRDLARTRTAHLGLSSLDVSVVGEEDLGLGKGTPGADYEAAKRAAGLPPSNRSGQPPVLSMGRGKGIGGLLSSPIYAARFQLDALTNGLLEPLSDLLENRKYLLGGNEPSSLDCMAFGYLALMFYPPVPQAWLKEAIQSRFPRIQSYITCMRGELLGGEETNAANVWSISTKKKADSGAIHRSSLPWHPQSSPGLFSNLSTAAHEVMFSLPLLSTLLRRDVILHPQGKILSRRVASALPSPLIVRTLVAFSAVVTAALAGLAIHHRRSPRDGDLVFYALRPAIFQGGFGGIGEAESFLSVFANQIARPGAAYS